MNLINLLLKWETLVYLVSWVIGLYIFWRSNKEEIVTDRFYKLADIIFIVSAVIFTLMEYVRYGNQVWLPVVWVAIVMAYFRKNITDFWTILDNLILPLYLLLAVHTLVGLVRSLSVVGILSLLITVLFILTSIPWIKKNYRTFSWYPSGKPGFLFLISALFYLLLSLLIDLYETPALYLSKLFLVVLFIVILKVFLSRTILNINIFNKKKEKNGYKISS